MPDACSLCTKYAFVQTWCIYFSCSLKHSEITYYLDSKVKKRQKNQADVFSTCTGMKQDWVK